MGRAPCCEKVGLKKGPWTPEEDKKLLAFVQKHGHGNWRSLPSKAGLRRCGKSCRLRWINYLKPDIKRGNFSLEEDRTIIQLHALLGNKWSIIAAHLPNRTDNEIKNYWNTNVKKRLIKMGIDPITHKPKAHIVEEAHKSKDAINMSHMAQWESARLEAEARESMLQLGSSSCTSNSLPQLIITKIPNQLSPNNSQFPLSTKRNNYNTYAIMLSTNDLQFSSSYECDGNNNIIETNSSQTQNVTNYVENLQDEDEIIMEAFRAARCDELLLNGASAMEGSINDFDGKEMESSMLEPSFNYWSNLLHLDYKCGRGIP